MLLWSLRLDVAPWNHVVMEREVSPYQSKIYFYTVLLHSVAQPGVCPPSLKLRGWGQVESGGVVHVRGVRHSNALFVWVRERCG